MIMEKAMNNRIYIVGLVMKASFITLALLTLTSTSQAQVEFNFNYTDVGTGFNDPINGAIRRSTLESSADILEAYFANYTATIDIDVDGSAVSGLAAAGSNYTAAWPGVGFVDRGDVMRQILGGDAADPSPGASDGTVTWNFSTVNWEYGNDFQAGEYDFVSTAIHELLHTVGFLSGISQDGSDFWGSDVNNPGTWEAFDQFVADSAGALINPTTFINDKTRWDVASIGGTGTNGLFFNGPNAVAANGGNDVNLYSPGTWLDGSSGSHLDDDAYGGTFITESTLFDGLGIRELSDVELGILRDIGYTNLIGNLVSAVPEPAGIPPIAFITSWWLIHRRRHR